MLRFMRICPKCAKDKRGLIPGICHYRPVFKADGCQEHFLAFYHTQKLISERPTLSGTSYQKQVVHILVLKPYSANTLFDP